MLLTEWLARQSSGAFPGGSAWLGLTEGRPATTLWHRLSESLNLPAAAHAPLTTPLTEAAELAEQLAERALPTLLVIDDAHLATDPVTLAGLEHFLVHAPDCLTTVLAARFEPPIRWHQLALSSRLRRWTAEDLAFSPAEVAQICREHDCALDDSGIALLMSLTRGWAALVRIAALYLAARSEPPAAALTALARLPNAVSDLLTGELIDTLPPGIRMFLTYTSVPDEFTEPLADDLIGGGSAQWLHELARLNYPLMSVVRNDELWYSYHPMLRAYFRAELNRLGPEVANELHSHTALYLGSIGEAADALPHLLNLPNREPLHDFLAQHALSVILDGRGTELFEGLATLDATLLADPFIQLLHVADALSRADVPTARAHYDAMKPARAQPSSLVSADIRAVLAAAVTAELGLATATRPERPDVENSAPTGQPDLDCYLAVETATTLLARGELHEGERRLRAALAAADLRAHPRLRLRVLTRLAMAAALAGTLTTLRERGEAALAFARQHDLSAAWEAAHAAALTVMGAYLQGEAQHASDLVPPIHAADRLGTDLLEPASGSPTQLVAILTATEDNSAAELLRQRLSRLLDTQPTAFSSGLVPLVVWRLLRARETYEAQLLTDHAHAVFGDTPEIALARAALAATANRSRTVLDLVRPLLASSPPAHPVHEVTAWLLHARAHHELGCAAKAREGVESGLRRAAGEQIVRPFLDVPGALTLLDAFAGSFGRYDGFAAALRRHPLVHRTSQHPSLTDTELKVLRHLPSAHSTQQIADDLGVSINTVKTHLRGIYAKLGTNSRVQVLAAARSSGLL
ncbi:LuxR C-terminal-related transcriptional regulator [Nocardia goodfellowii]|uniref:LuxR family maltose regulon positive regulatory protein n=1 Tax=Nocardia goodfellowii TaxID=882446 RepID=A0ABS4QLR2_9NOCA|nr:LuxR C-terminal-related transcriptional regulator [Nocardia goodfellowii]MBP2191606.1 LuxR family maltose regulon positive regulatory protein [Nocardia goodfellowii]